MLLFENNGETRKVLLEVPHVMGVGMQTLPGALLCIAQRLETVKLRSDYRQRLLVLCSDVGRAAEAKEGRFVYYLLVKVVWVSANADGFQSVAESSSVACIPARFL